MIASLGFVGCTPPTQPAAERDLQVAAQQFDTITYDLAAQAKYAAKKKAIDTVKASNDPVEREAAVKELSKTYANVEFLRIQAERAQGLLRSGREWVRAQRGIFDVVLEDIKAAKAAAVDPVDVPVITTVVVTTQPAQ